MLNRFSIKKFPGILLAILLLPGIGNSQENKRYTQGATFAVHFLYHDFNTASAIRASSLSSVIRNKEFGKVRDMSPGLALNYIKGLSNSFDFSTMLAGSFLDYPAENGGTLGDNSLLLELDASVRGKMFSSRYLVSPYLQLGVGMSKYKGYWSAFIPAGVGLQVNISDEALLLVNSQYRIPVIDNNASHHFFYSIGLAGVIGKKRNARPVNPPVTQIPSAPVVSDRDADGILDSADLCPDVPGMAMFKGCPDIDSDGIPDNDDKCPKVKGVARYQGCPVPDSDGDGINDEEDKCIPVPGVARYNGCPVPDRDQDSVNDELDKCPDVQGTIANSGCPEIKEEVRKKVELAAKNIFFATGSYQLLAKSNVALNEVVTLLQADRNLKLLIEGHTDNTGTPEKNQVLSARRAKAVYDYLGGNGIDIERLEFGGFGETKPVAENTNATGKAKNRRVELILHYN